MSRLPNPGADDGTWGEILNDYLTVAHGADGTIKNGVIQEAQLDSALRSKLNTPTTIADNSITEAKLSPQVQSKLNSTSSGVVSSVNNQTGDVTIDRVTLGLGNVDNTSDVNKPISAAAQTALNNKAAITHTHGVVDITGLQAVLDSKAATASLASVATTGSYTDLVNKPVIPQGPSTTDDLPEGTVNLYFKNSRAANAAPVQSVAGKSGTVILAKSDVGLSNVDNTADVNKPISAATQTALNLKADAAALGAKVLLIDNAAALPAGTPAGVVVVVKS